jgi:Holliday junction resolvasome RuvABC ATP-dependent DNA helicase subunit
MPNFGPLLNSEEIKDILQRIEKADILTRDECHRLKIEIQRLRMNEAEFRLADTARRWLRGGQP